MLTPETLSVPLLTPFRPPGTPNAKTKTQGQSSAPDRRDSAVRTRDTESRGRDRDRSQPKDEKSRANELNRGDKPRDKGWEREKDMKLRSNSVDREKGRRSEPKRDQCDWDDRLDRHRLSSRERDRDHDWRRGSSSSRHGNRDSRRDSDRHSPPRRNVTPRTPTPPAPRSPTPEVCGTLDYVQARARVQVYCTHVNETPCCRQFLTFIRLYWDIEYVCRRHFKTTALHEIRSRSL